MKKFFLAGFILTFIFSISFLKAQTIHPDVLVVGNSSAAFAAAFQSAQSNAKTVLLLQSGGFDINEPVNSFPSGIEAQFIEKIEKYFRQIDSSKVYKFDKLLANQVINQWTDSIKNLTIIKSSQWIKASRSGQNWRFKLSDKRLIKPKILIICADDKLKTFLKINSDNFGSMQTLNPVNTIIKTSVATAIQHGQNQFISLYQLLDKKNDNLVYINDNSSMAIGQAAGAIAAFAGFFNLNLSDINLRKTQAELLNYKANLLPIMDVSISNPNWKSIQMLATTQVLKLTENQGKMYFYPDSVVKINEIEQAMKDHFYKAQLWFDDHRLSKFSLEACIDLVRYVGNKSTESTTQELEKKWKTAYGFKSEFDLKKLVTRAEFTVILMEYCSPFVVTIDQNGHILR